MNRINLLLKEWCILIIACFLCGSCTDRSIPKSLPVEKIYIMEFEPVLESWDEEGKPQWGIEMLGLAELKNNFDLKITKQTESHSGKYFGAEFSLPDSLRKEIYRIIRENQKDTTYLYQEEMEDAVYEDRCKSHQSFFEIVIERRFYESTRIFFNKEYLPEDLRFLFDLLYAHSLQEESWDQYRQWIDKMQPVTIKSLGKYWNRMIPPPPPLLKETLFLDSLQEVE